MESIIIFYSFLAFCIFVLLRGYFFYGKENPWWIHEYNFLLKLIATFVGVFLAIWLNNLNEKNVYLDKLNKSIIEVESIHEIVSSDCKLNFINRSEKTITFDYRFYKKQYPEPEYFFNFIDHSDNYYNTYILRKRKLKTTLAELNSKIVKEERSKKIYLINQYKENLEDCFKTLKHEMYFLENRTPSNSMYGTGGEVFSQQTVKMEKFDF